MRKLVFHMRRLKIMTRSVLVFSDGREIKTDDKSKPPHIVGDKYRLINFVTGDVDVVTLSEIIKEKEDA